MSEQRTKLETALSDLTRWNEEIEPTWAAAAGIMRPAGSSIGSTRWWNRSIPYASIAAMIVIGGLLIGALLPALGKARSAGRAVPAAASADSRASESSLRVHYPPSPLPVPSERAIIRRFDIELLSADVRAAFNRLPALLSESRGEYIEQSAFSGVGLGTTASATLRVPAERLGAVLAALRDLGTLSSESSSGEDVTEQAVDLDARLRNEQRVEKELLSLLESRHGAPLKEILELRESLRGVRDQIERLSAQQQSIGRLVSLATIRVSIRTEQTVPVSVGFWKTATDRISATWNDSVRIALDAFAGLLAVVVGGAFWWLLLGVLGFGAMKIWRRYQRQATFEPPPRL